MAPSKQEKRPDDFDTHGKYKLSMRVESPDVSAVTFDKFISGGFAGGFIGTATIHCPSEAAYEALVEAMHETGIYQRGDEASHRMECFINDMEQANMLYDALKGADIHNDPGESKERIEFLSHLFVCGLKPDDSNSRETHERHGIDPTYVTSTKRHYIISQKGMGQIWDRAREIEAELDKNLTLSKNGRV